MQRSSGVLMHVSSLWGKFSCGSFGQSAREWIDFLHQSGFTYWQVLPFCLPDEYNSPYKSYSTFSINPYFIDIEKLFCEGLITKEEYCSCYEAHPYFCEFDRLSQNRVALLTKAAMRYVPTPNYDSFFENHPEVDDFCRFMAMRQANGNAEWHKWTVQAYDEKEYLAWRFMQYQAFSQWKEIKCYANQKGIKIIGDIPMYVAFDSADVWAAPQMFQLDQDGYPSSVAGVPPDYFAEDGQLWGNPLYDWDEMKKDGYSWWQRRLGFMCEMFDGVRIDHFRALESYYAIPAKESTAKNGKWIKGPGMPFIEAIKKACNDKLIIAEDLGDITPEVYQLVEDSGFPGMRVLQFGLLGDNHSIHLPHSYRHNCIAYTGTHDNNTLLGYVWELDETSRNRFLAYFGYTDENWDNCYDTVLRSMLASHAGLVIFPVQDLLRFGRDTRLNIPGSSTDANWAFRVTHDQFQSIDRKKLSQWNEIYGRK